MLYENLSELFMFYCSTARVGLMHIGVFILLLLSGERNFGVRLNKPYTVRVPMDIPVFTGTHADFLIIVSRVCVHMLLHYCMLLFVCLFVYQQALDFLLFSLLSLCN